MAAALGLFGSVSKQFFAVVLLSGVLKGCFGGLWCFREKHMV